MEAYRYILIVLEKIVVCVENKVLAREQSNQLSSYKKNVEREFLNHHQTFVYLTLERIVSEYIDPLRTDKIYITYDTTILKRELMKTDELDRVAPKNLL